MYIIPFEMDAHVAICVHTFLCTFMYIYNTLPFKHLCAYVSIIQQYVHRYIPFALAFETCISKSHTELVWILLTTIRSFVNQTKASLFHPAVLHWEVLPLL